MNAELTFLQFLQSLHSPMLDGSMCFITRLGDSGILWVTLTAVLLVLVLLINLAARLAKTKLKQKQ